MDTNIPDLKGVTPYDYQQAAIDAFLKAERGIVIISTRGGKTLVAAAIAQLLNVKTLFAVHKTNLMDQARDDFEGFLGTEVGIIGDTEWNPKRITIGMIQTSGNKVKAMDADTMEFLRDVEFVGFDEVHRNSTRYQRVQTMLPEARWRLGLSATAMMTTKENMLYTMALCGPVIYEIEMQELVEGGRLAKPYLYFVDVPDRVRVRKYKGWPTMYADGIVNHLQRNLMIALTAMKMVRRNKTVMILVQAKAHGAILEEMLREKTEVQFIQGKDKRPARKKALEDLESGKLKVLVTTEIFSEGQDMPFLEVLIQAAGGKSIINFYQRSGRPMTKTETKNFAIIIDFIDHSCERLYEHSQERITIASRNPAFEVKEISYDEI